MIKDYSTKSFRPFFEKHLDTYAKVLTDQWNSYKPLKECYTELEQEKSNKSKNFKHIHTIIMNLKSWIRGIHHKCSKKHFQELLRRNDTQTKALTSYQMSGLLNKPILFYKKVIF